MNTRIARIACTALLGLPAAGLAQSTDPSTAPGGATGVQGTSILIPNMQQLTITGEYRLRFEDRYNYDLRSSTTDDDDFFTQRFRLNFGAKLTDNLDAYVQFQDVRNWGSETSTTDGSADMFDIHQGWIRLKDVPGIGGTAKLGRQAISFGDQRLIGALEWASQGRAFDGYVQSWNKEKEYTLHTFVLQVAEMGLSTMYQDALVIGAYGSMDGIENTELEFYAIHLNNEETAAGGTENRTTIGLRYEQQMGDVELGAELATQTGEVNNADIPIGDAYALHVHATYTFQAETKPYLRVEYNDASGNDPNTTDNERFNNLFPTAHAHLGMMDLALWENISNIAVQFGFKPDANGKLAVTWHSFAMNEETDRFGGPAGNNFGNIGPGGSTTVGSEVDVFYHRTFDTKPVKSYMQSGYGIFLPGSAANVAVGSDHTAHFFYLTGGVKF